MRQFLRSKIHRATITRTDLHYEGSLTLDRDLMDAAAIADHEVIHVVNVNNGERFTTYAIEGREVRELSASMVPQHGSGCRAISQSS